MPATENSNRAPHDMTEGGPVSLRPGWVRRLGHSISAKLMISIFFVLIVIFGLFGFFSIRSHRRQLEEAARTAAERQSEVLRRSASLALW